MKVQVNDPCSDKTIALTGCPFTGAALVCSAEEAYAHMGNGFIVCTTDKLKKDIGKLVLAFRTPAIEYHSHVSFCLAVSGTMQAILYKDVTIVPNTGEILPVENVNRKSGRQSFLGTSIWKNPTIDLTGASPLFNAVYTNFEGMNPVRWIFGAGQNYAFVINNLGPENYANIQMIWTLRPN